MKVLWVTPSNTFYNQGDKKFSNNGYNGGGWIGAQQIELMKDDDIELAIMFTSKDIHDNKRVIDGVRYYPIIEKVNILTHLKRFYFPPESSYFDRVKKQVDQVIEDFSPDLIHVFGLECNLAEIIYNYDIPHLVHLQGLMLPYAESYLPPAISLKSIYCYGKWWRERIFNNGFRYYYNVTKSKCQREIYLCRHLKNCTGRTHWDRAMMALYAQNAKYYHVNEILRPQFYSESPVLIRKDIKILKITSTISDTLYKGLDLILKTAKILEERDISYEWHIIGINDRSDYLNLVKRVLNYEIPAGICFDGKLQPSEIIDRFNQTDVYVHPSYVDNSPNSICEAQIIGLPVVATNVGGVASLIVNNETGILVPANEPHILAYSLISLKENYSIRQRIAENGCKLAHERHDKKFIMNQLREIYRILSKDEK